MQLELLCQQLYESSDSEVRARAEKSLVAFAESSNSLPQCQIVLERSQVGRKFTALYLVFEHVGHSLKEWVGSLSIVNAMACGNWAILSVGLQA